MLKTITSVANTVGALEYKGLWNAATNTPTLVSSVGTQGDYYVVSVAGTTNLDGVTTWDEGDWAIFNGSVWQLFQGGQDGVFATLTVSGEIAANGGIDVTGTLTATGAEIGTTSDAYSAIFIISSVTGESELRMGDTDTDAGSISYTNVNDTMTFRAAAASRLTINSTGIDVTGTALADTLETSTGSGGLLNIIRNDPTIGIDNSLGAIYWKSTEDSGTTVNIGAGILALADQNHSTIASGSRLAFLTTAVSSTSATERLRISAGGDISFYEDTGTTPKFVWSSADESLTVPVLITTGNTTLGDASTDTVRVNGYMGVGGAGNSAISVLASSTALGSSTQHGFYSLITGTSSATSLISGFTSLPATAAASFTVADVYGYRASNATKGAGSTITNQHGVYIADQTQGTNNYGITSLVSSGTNKWNIYASGTAANYFAGSVGIGATSPATALHIAGSGLGASAPTIRIANTTNSGDWSGITSAMGRLEFYSEDSSGNAPYTTGFIESRNDFTSGTPTLPSGALVFGTTTYDSASGAVERMRIDSSGRVGIGGASGKAWISSDANVGYFGGDSGQTNHISFYDALDLVRIYTAGAERMRIDASGNVAIGTSSTGFNGQGLPLVVGSGTGNTGMTIFSGADSYGTLQFADAVTTGAASYAGVVSYNHTNNFMYFSTASTERMRIDSSGNLLVGKTSSGIGVVGTEVRASGQLLVTADADNPADFSRKTSDGIIALFRKDSTAVGSIGTVGSDLVITSSVSDHKGLRFGLNYIAPIDTGYSFTDATTDLGLSDVRFRDLYLSGGTIVGGRTTFGSAGFWDASGTGNNKGLRVGGAGLYPTDGAGTALNSTLDIGTAVARFKDLYLSGGVYLGGTGAANKLDDYESGSWTPVYTADSGAATHYVQTGSYVKVGKLVTVTGELQASRNTLSGAVTITGLPFASSGNGGGFNPTFTIRFASDMPNLKGYTSASSIVLKTQATSSTNSVNVIETDLSNTATNYNYLYFTATYMTA